LALKELLGIVLDSGFQLDVEKNKKIYFPKGWKDPDFDELTPQVMRFQIKTSNPTSAS